MASPASRPGPLAAHLRARDDAALRALLRARPDLARPAAGDLTALAGRAVTPASVRLALDALDTPHLRTFEAVCVAASAAGPGRASVEAVARLLDADAALVTPVLERLVDLALVHRDEAGYGPQPGSPEVPVAGLAAYDADDETLAAVVAGVEADTPAETVLGRLTEGAPEGAATILGALRWGPPTGVVDWSGPLGPAAEWLLERRLLRAVGPEEVELPRPVALALRQGRLHRDATFTPPAVESRTHPVETVDAAGGAAAGELLSLVETLARAWGEEPPRVLRSGGLAVRDLTRTAGLTGWERPGVLVEMLFAAGLIAQDNAVEPSWAPTGDYDEWLTRPDEIRWAELVLAWRDMMRAPHRIGTRGPNGTGTINALSADVGHGTAPTVRRRILHALASVPPGVAPTPEARRALLAWHSPRLGPGVAAEFLDAVVSEAELLGLVASGALTTAGRALVAASENGLAPGRETDDVDAVTPETARLAAAACLPTPVTEVIHQADLTSIAPGRLSGPVAAVLTLAAELESRGAASVFRFSPDSVRRAFDAGWTDESLLAELTRIGATPVPQPLAFLVHDTWRTNGRARVGAASAYLTCGDPSDLDALLARPEAAAARFRRIAPTVLVTHLAPNQLSTLVRDAGVHALLEGPDGAVVSGAAAPVRAVTPRRRPVAAPPPSDAGLREVVTAMRAAEARRVPAGGASSGGDVESCDDPSTTLARLRQAVGTGAAVWIGVAGRDGTVGRHLVRPTRVEAGRLHATSLDDGPGGTRTWPLMRITGVTPID